MSESISDRLLEFIKARDHVSFAELGREFPECRDGNHAIELGENLLLWAGMSQEACQVLSGLLEDGAIHAVPSQVLIYLLDGAIPKLPVAKRGGPYKKPHWLPVTLRPGPNPKRQARKARVR